MNHNIPQYDFYKHKYGDELLIDVVPLNTIKKYLKEQPVHILTYYDITLITSGEGEFLIDHQANRVKPQDIIFTRPGEIRKWDDKTIQDGFALIFEEEFLLSFFNDPAFLRNLSYFHTERRSSKLSLDKKAYARISELISEIDKEIKNYQSKDKHLLRALLYETLMLLNRLYSNSNALPPDTNTRSKSIYVDRFIVKNATGINAKQYILNKILIESKRLLTYTDLPISAITEALGYEDPSYFIRLFRSQTNMTPLNYRRNTKP